MVTANIQHRQVNGGLQGAFDRLRGLQKRRIMVGIPAQKSSRPKEPINNAELLYIHTHGIRKPHSRHPEEGDARGDGPDDPVRHEVFQGV